MAGDGSVKLFDERTGKRTDGRRLDELRPTSIEVGVLANADGSALIKMGKNKILAAVYGPRELHPKHLALPDKALVQCYYRMSTFSVADRKSPAPSRREREISKVLSDALNSVVLAKNFPRTTIDIYVQVLQADGGTRCASLTAACTALADAGIPMRGIIAGVAAGLINDKVALDLYDLEDQKGSGDIPVGYSPTLDEISLLQLDGVFTLEQFDDAVKLAIKGAKEVYELQKEALRNKYASIRVEVNPEQEEEAEDEDTIQVVTESLAESGATVSDEDEEEEHEVIEEEETEVQIGQEPQEEEIKSATDEEEETEIQVEQEVQEEKQKEEYRTNPVTDEITDVSEQESQAGVSEEEEFMEVDVFEDELDETEEVSDKELSDSEPAMEQSSIPTEAQNNVDVRSEDD